MPLRTTYAEEVQARRNPCQPTAEELARYEADGTLGWRRAHMESLHHELPARGLMRCLANGGADGMLGAQSLASEHSFMYWDASFPSEGDARVLALRISFPQDEVTENRAFAEEDSGEALQQIVGPRIDGTETELHEEWYPYESLDSYYERSSYGKLSVSGEVYDYQAKMPRSSYKDPGSSLLPEALAALDERIDYRQFDGNSDGIIDVAVIRFAGLDEGWGSTWWSSASEAGFTQKFDGVGAGTVVLIHEPSHTVEAASALIHEVGHAMGLTDYYREERESHPEALAKSGLGGIMTFDMMNNTTGDHNGFSKWMLGWIGEDASSGATVTRVVANESGITVRHGDEIQRFLPDAATGEVSATVDMSAFTSDDLEPGDVVVVSNEDKGPFSSYYLLQYDRYAGNQRVQWLKDDQEHPLPSGLRVFRVRADKFMGRVEKTNTTGVVHDQLIELVDPDEHLEHTQDPVPVAKNASTYGCMLYEGDEITPVSTPVTTNFMENSSIGFTGLSFKLVEGRQDGGKVQISYSPENESSGEFTLKPVDGQVRGGGAEIAFDASFNAIIREFADQQYLTVEGSARKYYAQGKRVDGKRVYVAFDVDPEVLRPGTKCTVTFPQGDFIIDMQGGLSEEMVLEGIVGSSDIAPLVASGDLSDYPLASNPVLVSPVVAPKEGMRTFFRIEEGVLYALSFDVDRPMDVSKVAIDVPRDALSTEFLRDGKLVSHDAILDAEMLTDGKVRLTAYNLNFDIMAFDVDLDRHVTGPWDVAAVPWVQKLPEAAWLAEGEKIEAIARHATGTYMLVKAESGDLSLRRYDDGGTLRESADVDFAGVRGARHRLDVRPDGAVAVTRYTLRPTTHAPQASLFYNKDLVYQSRHTAYGPGCCTWLDDGRFMTIGERAGEFVVRTSSLLEAQTEERPTLVYDITAPIAWDDPEDVPGDGTDQKGGDESDDGEGLDGGQQPAGQQPADGKDSRAGDGTSGSTLAPNGNGSAAAPSGSGSNAGTKNNVSSGNVASGTNAAVNNGASGSASQTARTQQPSSLASTGDRSVSISELLAVAAATIGLALKLRRE